MEIARAGQQAGCMEALFTLGDQPEKRYSVARDWLERRGHSSTLSYLAEVAKLVLDNTTLLPHLNPGVMGAKDFERLRPVSVSMGLMMENLSMRLHKKGGAHFGSPDKLPQHRLSTLEEAGRAHVPITTGLLIGIGETRIERLETLIAIRDMHRRHNHIQEVIIQNFRAKPGTKMSAAAEPSLEEHLWSIAAARIVLGPEMSIQAPPNLQDGDALGEILRAGVNDWGGVSPVTRDHVNPEAPWPQLGTLEELTRRAGRNLVDRLAIGPQFAQEPERWLDPGLVQRVRRVVDARGLPRSDGWFAGQGKAVPSPMIFVPATSQKVGTLLAKVEKGASLNSEEIVTLFESDAADMEQVTRFADELRREAVGEAITYVVNRNINYTNICLYKCGFCAFSKGSTRSMRGAAYRLDYEEIGMRAAEAVDKGATEVCLQGGIHPEYDGDTYLGILEAVRRQAPGVHIHAFSPLEVWHGASTSGLSLGTFIAKLKAAGLATLPGTAAEILDDEVRAVICPDKVSAEQWLEVMESAHETGLRSTATIMFGHVDGYRHWARHLLRIRELQQKTGGFTEFVPLPFVHMEAPIWRKGLARSGPTWRETILMHAISRIVLHPIIPNIQSSWVKLGLNGAAAMLRAGANDMGGTLMDESITRAAGGANGQQCTSEQFERVGLALSRPIRQRTTLYSPVTRRVMSAA